MANPRPKTPAPSLEFRTYQAAVAAHEVSPHGDMMPGDPGLRAASGTAR